MAKGTFEEHLVEADSAVQHGHWQDAIQSLKQAQQIEPEHTAVLTALGMCYIQLDQVQTAVEYFENVTRLAPDVFEAHNNLGVVYTLTGQYDKAEKACRRAIEIDDQKLEAWKNLAQVCLQQDAKLTEGVKILAALVQSHPEDSGVMVMMANVYIEGGDPNSAELFFKKALELHPDHPDAAAGLAQVADLRAKQALPVEPKRRKKVAAPKGKQPDANSQPQHRNAAYVKGSSYSRLRMNRVFHTLGWPLTDETLKTEFTTADLENVGFAVFSQPHLSIDLIQAINAFLQAGKPYGVDLEQDFFQMPPDHPAYGLFGPGNPQALKTLELILAKAEWVSVPSCVLAEQLKPYCREVRVVLPGWDSTNPLWKKPAPKRNAVHIGWIGSAAEHADLLTIKMDLVKLSRAYPDAVFVFVGDDGALDDFNRIPEKNKIFLPSADADEMPYVLSHFDILMVPWRDLPYNRAKSDLALVEAGARAIPWVASSIPSYLDWGVGGVLTKKHGEWFAALGQLVENEERRKNLGAAGQEKAEGRKV